MLTRAATKQLYMDSEVFQTVAISVQLENDDFKFEVNRWLEEEKYQLINYFR